MNQKKSAKKLIKLAKQGKKLYNKSDIIYAKMILRSLKKKNGSND